MPEVADLILKHYAADEGMTFDPAYDYSTRQGRDDKPTGFWVSVAGEDDWHRWCTSNGFRTDALANEYDVTLALDARILHIASLHALKDLARRYPAPVPEWRKGSLWTDYAYPDWQDIATEHDGIIIAPYQWPARYDLSWYYGWDCASGCIWNLDVIASVTPASAEVLL